MSDRPAGRPVPPLARASARKRANTGNGTNDETNAERGASARGEGLRRSGREGVKTPEITSSSGKEATVNKQRAKPRAGTLGGSNRMLSARDVAAILAVPERTIREKWREWDLPAYRIGKHLRWKEREVHAWIDRHAA